MRIGFQSVLSSPLLFMQDREIPLGTPHEWPFREVGPLRNFIALLHQRFPQGTTIVVDAASVPELYTLRMFQLFPRVMGNGKGRLLLSPFLFNQEPTAITHLGKTYPLDARNEEIGWQQKPVLMEKQERIIIDYCALNDTVKRSLQKNMSVSTANRCYYNIHPQYQPLLGPTMKTKDVLDAWIETPRYNKPIAVISRCWQNFLTTSERLQLARLMADKLPSKSIVLLGLNELTVGVDQLLMQNGFKPAEEPNWKMYRVQATPISRGKMPRTLSDYENQHYGKERETHSGLPQKPVFIYERV